MVYRQIGHLNSGRKSPLSRGFSRYSPHVLTRNPLENVTPMEPKKPPNEDCAPWKTSSAQARARASNPRAYDVGDGED